MSKKVVVYSAVQEKNLLKYEARVDSFDDYQEMQKFVGGYIELLPIPIVIEGQHYDIFINEEGKMIEGLLPAIVMLHKGQIHDITMGNFFISKSDEEGESVSLDYDEIKKIQHYVERNTSQVLFDKKETAELLVMEF